MDRNSVNRVLLVGHLGGDADVRFTPKGTAVANLSVATNESRKTDNGEWDDRTEWHKVVIFGKLAEFCEKHVKKGAFVFLEGHLQTRTWDDKEEVKHYMTEVVGERLTLLGSKRNGNSVSAKENAVAEDGEAIPF